MPSTIICLVGPTSAGKSQLAILMAQKFSGEIVSVDSRQIYRGLNLGTSKIPVKRTGQIRLNTKIIKDSLSFPLLTYKNIPHWAIDIASPKRQYSVANFQSYAKKIIAKIIKRKNLPILCGGSMHWFDAVVYNQQLPKTKPNLKLRKNLANFTSDELYTKLAKLDPVRAKNIDAKNPRRLIRALEIIHISGNAVKPLHSQPLYDPIWIGLKPEMTELKTRIITQLQFAVRRGLIQEVKNLLAEGVSFNRLEKFGLEYKYVAWFLQNRINRMELEEQLGIKISQYAKRQLTWWKNNPAIHWFTEPNSALEFADQMLAKRHK